MGHWSLTVVSIASYLNNASSFFFFSGFVIGKLQNLPIPVVSTILSATSTLCYLLGYGLWFLTSRFYPGQEIDRTKWHGFD